jgi:serine/threonine protein kinase
LVVFCKVWQEGIQRTPWSRVHSEFANLVLAYKHGISCPRVVEGISAMDLKHDDGIYHMLVMSYHEQHLVAPSDVIAYALSLIKTIIKLHHIGLLHCNINPPNVAWDGHTKLVHILDFGHSQMQSHAESYRASPEFEAPEICKGMPHSYSTDAYSVGKTLLIMTASALRQRDGFSSTTIEHVEGVARQLCRELPLDRMSLEDAERKLSLCPNDCVQKVRLTNQI